MILFSDPDYSDNLRETSMTSREAASVAEAQEMAQREVAGKYFNDNTDDIDANWPDFAVIAVIEGPHDDS